MAHEFRPFNRDFNRLAAVIEDAWAGNAEQPLHYTPAFLESLYDHPGFDLRFSPAIYDGEDLVASLSSLPRQALFNGESLRFQLYSLLTVAPSHRKLGLAKAAWAEHSRQGVESGLDGSIGFCVEGDVWNQAFLAVAQSLNLPSWRIHTIPYMAKFFRPAKDSFPTPVATGEDTLAIFLEAAGLVAAPANSFIRQWTPEEAAWQCLNRDGAIAATLASGPRRGAIAGYRMDTMGATKVPCALIDDLLWGDLEPEECLVLLDRFLAVCFHRGIQMVISPVLPYASTAPLEARAFRRTRRLLHCYYTSWNGRGPAGPVDSLYLDVF
jgi:hypothetical protein